MEEDVHDKYRGIGPKQRKTHGKDRPCERPHNHEESHSAYRTALHELLDKPALRNSIIVSGLLIRKTLRVIRITVRRTRGRKSLSERLVQEAVDSSDRSFEMAFG